jgi:hypothetical protein
MGAFLIAGRITTADNVPGERRGQSFLRTWTFTPTCPAGSCQSIVLARPRALGADTLTLHRRRPGYYTGRAKFYAPVRCGSRTYARGAAVPFTITVTVTAATLDPTGAVLASRVNATYENRARTNLTPCVGVLGHDAASYHGHRLLIPSA